MADRTTTRSTNASWQHIYGVDRKYTRRVDAAKERGQYTEPGTPSKAKKVKVVPDPVGPDGLPLITPDNPYGLSRSKTRSRRLPRPESE